MRNSSVRAKVGDIKTDRAVAEDGKERTERTKKMKITHLEQSFLNYSPHILPPLRYVRVELIQIWGER